MAENIKVGQVYYNPGNNLHYCITEVDSENLTAHYGNTVAEAQGEGFYSVGERSIRETGSWVLVVDPAEEKPQSPEFKAGDKVVLKPDAHSNGIYHTKDPEGFAQDLENECIAYSSVYEVIRPSDFEGDALIKGDGVEFYVAKEFIEHAPVVAEDASTEETIKPELEEAPEPTVSLAQLEDAWEYVDQSYPDLAKLFELAVRLK